MFAGERRTLIVGDYTTDKLFNKFHIERKSLEDLYGTITSGNARFKAELFRAAYHQIRLPVYVEGTRADFVAKKFNRGDERKVKSDTLEKLLHAFEKKYYVVFVFCKSRFDCISKVEKCLHDAENQQNPRKPAKSGRKRRK